MTVAGAPAILPNLDSHAISRVNPHFSGHCEGKDSHPEALHTEADLSRTYPLIDPIMIPLTKCFCRNG
jgi:hypothetical protein